MSVARSVLVLAALTIAIGCQAVLAADCCPSGCGQACGATACGDGCVQPSCGGCAPATVTTTVMVPEYVMEVRKVKTVECVPETRQCKYTEWQCIPETKTVNVEYTVMVPETRTQTQTYCVQMPVTRTVTEQYQVQVPTYRDVERTYTVCVPVMKNVVQQYTVMVPHTETRQATRQMTRCVPVTETRTVTVDRGHWEDACNTGWAHAAMRVIPVAAHVEMSAPLAAIDTDAAERATPRLAAVPHAAGFPTAFRNKSP